MLNSTTGVQTTEARHMTLFIQLIYYKENRGKKKEEGKREEEEEGKERSLMD